jgi:hypothetical protein
MTVEIDRRQIGLTAEGKRTVAILTTELGWFTEAQEAGRFALAVAVHEGVAAGATAGVDTVWSVDGFDASGEIRALLGALYPDTATPVRLMEHLINEGLHRIADRVAAGERNPAALLG